MQWNMGGVELISGTGGSEANIDFVVDMIVWSRSKARTDKIFPSLREFGERHLDQDLCPGGLFMHCGKWRMVVHTCVVLFC